MNQSGGEIALLFNFEKVVYETTYKILVVLS